MIYFFLDTLKNQFWSRIVLITFQSQLEPSKITYTHTKMEIEYEEKVKGEIPADKEADTQKPLRKKRKKREWEEAVEIIMPDE